jgi:hypothetical protein
MQLDIAWVVFLMWWLNQATTILTFASLLLVDTLNASCLHHVVAASLSAEYKSHQSPACPQQGGHCLEPEFLETLTDEEAWYYFW